MRTPQLEVGSRIRALAVTTNAELEATRSRSPANFTVEIEGETKPALVAEWLTRTVYT